MRIFYDVDTQNDFMNADGALYVPGAEGIKLNLEKLTEFARRNRIPTVGSVDRHFGTEGYRERETELARWGGPFPDHCMDGTFGQIKLRETQVLWSEMQEIPLRERAIYIPHELDGKVKRLALVRTISRIAPPLPDEIGVYFEKQSYNVFTNPAFELFLDLAEVEEAVVYGVATDYCVKAAALGMRKKGIDVMVVEDAVKGVSEDTTKAALEEMAAAEVKFVRTEDVT